MFGADSITQGGVPLNMESTGEEKFYELGSLITNLGGPIKSRYINLELRLEGVAGDFEKVLEMNEHRIRDKSLSIMGGYTYEDAQLDGFQERVRVDLQKAFSLVLKKYRDGESDLIRNIYFTQIDVQKVSLFYGADNTDFEDESFDLDELEIILMLCNLLA